MVRRVDGKFAIAMRIVAFLDDEVVIVKKTVRTTISFLGCKLPVRRIRRDFCKLCRCLQN